MKPRICEILGVEVGERFGTKNMGDCHVDVDGSVRLHYTGDNAFAASYVCKIINNPSLIIKTPKVTEEEKEILRAAKLLFDSKYIARDKGGEVWLYNQKPEKCSGVWIVKNPDSDDEAPHSIQHLFPYVKWEDKEPTLIDDLLR